MLKKLLAGLMAALTAGTGSGAATQADQFAENFVQEEKDMQPEPEYAPWNSRKKKDAPEEMHDFADAAENAASEERHFEEEEVSRMEESLDAAQINEEDVTSDETENFFAEAEEDIPPAGRGAYTVSQPTITDEDLSDMKDESLLDVISRKRKDSKKENKQNQVILTACDDLTVWYSYRGHQKTA